MESLTIFDTTLRDGEQSAGITFSTDQKLEIARQLVRLGVDVIEPGYAHASQQAFDSVREIAKQVREVVIVGCGQLHQLANAWRVVQDAEHPRIHTALFASPIHMERDGLTPETAKEKVASAIAFVKEKCEDIEFSIGDATRANRDLACEILQIAVENGATTLNLPDSVGYAVPGEYARLISFVRENVRGNYVISTHCHDDLGLAVANTLAGVEAGARQVECTMNGLGERAGNAPLEEVVMALRTRSDHYEVETNIHTEELTTTSQLVSRLSGYPVQYNKAIVGRNAFILSDLPGVPNLHTPETFQIIDPATVGWSTPQP